MHARPSPRPLLAVALFASLAAVTGCKLLKKGDDEKPAPSAAATSGAATPTEAAPTTGEAKAKAPPTAGCALPEDHQISGLVTLAKGCKLTVSDVIAVRAGGVLKIEPGVRLSFAANTYLDVEAGQLVAAGTKEDPIVFTSAATTKAPGDWGGLYFGPDVVAGTALEHVHIEYAGQDTSSLKGAITIADQKSPRRIGMKSCSVENNEQAAIQSLAHKGAFSVFQDNTLKGNKLSLDADPAVLASVGTGNTFGDPLRTGGVVDADATWPAFGAPILVRDTLKIEGETAAPTLTLAPGTVLKFGGNVAVSVGEGNGGGLVAKGVTFTSANATPHAGDWIGLFAYARTTALELAGATIAFAGADGMSSRGVVTFYDVDPPKVRRVDLTGTVIKDFAGAALAFPSNDCAAIGKGAKITGTPCRKE